MSFFDSISVDSSDFVFSPAARGPSAFSSTSFMPATLEAMPVPAAQTFDLAMLMASMVVINEAAVTASSAAAAAAPGFLESDMNEYRMNAPVVKKQKQSGNSSDTFVSQFSLRDTSDFSFELTSSDSKIDSIGFFLPFFSL